MRRGFVDGPDGQIFYRESGHGRPIVLLHQILRTSLDYEFVMPQLAQRHHVYAFDNMGCGDSDSPRTAYTIEAHATAIAAAMDALGVREAVIAGHHSGANQALELALQRPDLASAVVLSGLFYVDSREERARLRDKALGLADPAPKADGTHLLHIWEEGLRTNWGKPRFPAERIDLLSKFFVEQIKSGPRRFEPYVAIMSYPTEQRLPLLRAPCLFIRATDDIAMCAGSDLWRKDQPGGRLVEIETKNGGGEMPRLHASDWSRAILEFVADDVA